MALPAPRWILAGLFLASAARLLAAEPLLDWSDWEKYRGTVQHPSGAFKAADFDSVSMIRRLDATGLIWRTACIGLN